ncbi:M23/M56 family metallopeptidase [Hyphomonas sp. FCG-A18]|uniref:peptidoglycan DD-metalloendopeptidase family protein n=1 Tax=Hyphomonas sp. FCG-A18 TaxID=3080019 RepID=UPI002B284614|nr:M23/M56 family metallopeptidase [Hyphomonas sp. FCG-A18]
MIPVTWFILFSLIWTGVLTLAAFAMTRGPINAPFAHRVWQAAAGLMVVPWALCLAAPFLKTAPVPTPIPDTFEGKPFFDTGVLDDAAATGFSFELPNLGMILIALVLAGWAVHLFRYGLAQMRLQRIKRASEPAQMPRAAALAEAAGLSRTPELRLSSCGSPFIAGILRKTVYVPAPLMNAEDLPAIYIHECRHAARGDLIARPIERTLCAVFWFSPFIRLMQRQLDHWREAACDAEAAAALKDPVGYARALARTARMARAMQAQAIPVSPFIPPRNKSLSERLSHLLDAKPKQQRKSVALVGGIVALCMAPIALAQVSGGASSATVAFTHPVTKHKIAKVTSNYGERKDPFTKQLKWHNGTDIKGNIGDYVFAPAPGTVVFADMKGDYGKTVEIAMADGRKLRFAQLSEIKVWVGDKVEAGNKIGMIGKTGRATGPHLHFEVWVDDEPVDPETVDGLVLVKGY